MVAMLSKLSCLALLCTSLGFAPAAGTGILHGFVVDGAGQPVTDLTAVVTHLEGQFPFSGSQDLTATGEFVLDPTVGSYLVELQDETGEVVDYRTGVNIFNDITTFLFFTVDDPELCQTNLGFGSAGGMTLTLCGDDLTSADSLATLSVYNATPSGTVFMPIGLTNAPTPFKGGTLVPVPWLVLAPLTADTGGVSELAVAGAVGTPISLYLQVVDANGPSFRFSNAIEAVIGF